MQDLASLNQHAQPRLDRRTLLRGRGIQRRGLTVLLHGVPSTSSTAVAGKDRKLT